MYTCFRNRNTYKIGKPFRPFIRIRHGLDSRHAHGRAFIVRLFCYIKIKIATLLKEIILYQTNVLTFEYSWHGLHCFLWVLIPARFGIHLSFFSFMKIWTTLLQYFQTPALITSSSALTCVKHSAVLHVENFWKINLFIIYISLLFCFAFVRIFVACYFWKIWLFFFRGIQWNGSIFFVIFFYIRINQVLVCNK